MILLTVLIVATKRAYFPNLSDDNRIYYLVLVAITTLVSCFEITKYLYAARLSHRHAQRHEIGVPAPSAKTTLASNLRDAYRIIYPPESRPTLEIQEANFNHLLEHELAIYDLSEAGLGFHHDGRLPLSGPLLGRIRFSDGEYLEVAGDVVHHQHDRVGLALHCYIPHHRFMKEQRMLIARQKPDRLNLEAMRRSTGGGPGGYPDRVSGCPCQSPKS
jgi:hypothetical protein